MTERPTDESVDDVLDEPGRGADPGVAYRRAGDETEMESPEDEERRPDVGDVYRSGS